MGSSKNCGRRKARATVPSPLGFEYHIKICREIDHEECRAAHFLKPASVAPAQTAMRLHVCNELVCNVRLSLCIVNPSDVNTCDKRHLKSPP